MLLNHFKNMTNLPIYLDYAATTPLDSRVLEKMLPYLGHINDYGNASSQHYYGRQAASAIDQAREQVAALINAKSDEIIWTSSATEAINLAIKGISSAYQHKGKHIITAQTEHAAVFDTCRYLEQQGFTVTYLLPEKNGLITLDTIANAVQPDTVLINIMHVNNEMGVIQDIAAIAAFTKSKNIFLHVDAVQSAGKIPIDLQSWPVDLMSLSAHKLYGPKGIGALFIRNGIELAPQIHGGGQQRNLRSGTLATHQIVGMGAAFALAKEEQATEYQRIQTLRNQFWQTLTANLNGLHLNSTLDLCVPHIINIAFANVENKLLLPALKELAVASGSACHSANREPSRVLKALGVESQLINCALRFSFGRYTSAEEIAVAIKVVKNAVTRLRNLQI